MNQLAVRGDSNLVVTNFGDLYGWTIKTTKPKPLPAAAAAAAAAAHSPPPSADKSPRLRGSPGHHLGNQVSHTALQPQPPSRTPHCSCVSAKHACLVAPQYLGAPGSPSQLQPIGGSAAFEPALSPQRSRPRASVEFFQPGQLRRYGSSLNGGVLTCDPR